MTDYTDLKSRLSGPVSLDDVKPLMAEALRAIEGLERELEEARRDAERLRDAAEGHIEVLDAYPEQLVPVNRESASLRRLRGSIAARQQAEG